MNRKTEMPKTSKAKMPDMHSKKEKMSGGMGPNNRKTNMVKEKPAKPNKGKMGGKPW